MKIHYLTFDLDLGHTKVAQYPLHYVIYASTRFEVATSNGLGGDTITRDVTDGRTNRQTDARMCSQRFLLGFFSMYGSLSTLGI